ncbi:MAG: BrnT family toxin [Thermoanaerobaculia bacterium]
MAYEWDRGKAAANRLKHGIDFADAVTVFSDALALTVEELSADEPRFVTMGASAIGQVLVVAYTWRGNRIRMISARTAAPRERRTYERARKNEKRI